MEELHAGSGIYVYKEDLEETKKAGSRKDQKGKHGNVDAARMACYLMSLFWKPNFLAGATIDRGLSSGRIPLDEGIVDAIIGKIILCFDGLLYQNRTRPKWLCVQASRGEDLGNNWCLIINNKPFNQS